MKKTDDCDLSRRSMFKTGALVAIGAIAAGAILASEPAEAKASQKVAMYQNKPNGAQKCAGCARFKPGPTPGANGTCAIVDGSISPHGWCVYFTPKG